jgi:hypothetical protein
MGSNLAFRRKEPTAKALSQDTIRLSFREKWSRYYCCCCCYCYYYYYYYYHHHHHYYY